MVPLIYFKSDTVTLTSILPPSHTNVHENRDTTSSVRLTKGQGREARRHPSVHLRSMVVRRVGSSAKMEQDAPATPWENEA